MALRAGKLRDCVKIQKNTKTRNTTTGQLEDGWGTHMAEVACEIVEVKGDQFSREDVIQEARADVIIKMRNPGARLVPTATMRCVEEIDPDADGDTSRTFYIKYVQRKDRDRDLWLHCSFVAS